MKRVLLWLVFFAALNCGPSSGKECADMCGSNGVKSFGCQEGCLCRP